MSSEFCHLCGRKLSGQGKSYRHKKWARDLSLLICMDCDRQKPRCRVCDLPMASASHNGACATCNETMHLCLSCGEKTGSKHFEFDGIGPYCKTCRKERTPCDVCGAPLTDEHWQLSDGRVTCVYCHATVIYTPADAVALYEEMKSVVTEQLLGYKLNVPTGLALVDRNQLREIIHQQQDKDHGEGLDAQELDPQRTLGIYARRGMRRGIYVQTGLPRVLFLQVAAHEYAHAWQGENCPVLSDLLVHEGFAEWIAYRVMGYYGYTQAQKRMCARHDIYGRGLNWALDLEARQGIDKVIETCRRSM